MNFEQFLQLKECDQITALYNAVKLGQRLRGKIMYTLFQLDSFYVEVFIVNNKLNLFPFRSTYLLEPYLQGMDISYVYEILSPNSSRS